MLRERFAQNLGACRRCGVKEESASPRKLKFPPPIGRKSCRVLCLACGGDVWLSVFSFKVTGLLKWQEPWFGGLRASEVENQRCKWPALCTSSLTYHMCGHGLCLFAVEALGSVMNTGSSFAFVISQKAVSIGNIVYERKGSQMLLIPHHYLECGTRAQRT